MFLRFFVLAAGISLASCVIQEITFYSEADHTGDSVTFRSKRASLGNLESFVQASQSRCWTGKWNGYSDENYEGTLSLNYGFVSSRMCTSGALTTIKSLRYLGSMNTTTPSISLYHGTSDNSYSGEEVTITAQAASDFGFNPNGAILTGPSSWTIFPNADFTGSALCLVGEFEVHAWGFPAGVAKSVVRGCNPRKVSKYIYLP